jgi:hypothetical protein
MYDVDWIESEKMIQHNLNLDFRVPMRPPLKR